MSHCTPSLLHYSSVTYLLSPSPCQLLLRDFFSFSIWISLLVLPSDFIPLMTLSWPFILLAIIGALIFLPYYVAHKAVLFIFFKPSAVSYLILFNILRNNFGVKLTLKVLSSLISWVIFLSILEFYILGTGKLFWKVNITFLFFFFLTRAVLHTPLVLVANCEFSYWNICHKIFLWLYSLMLTHVSSSPVEECVD